MKKSDDSIIADTVIKVETKANYISLNKACEGTPYSQDYLSLRARQGKLTAIKQGRNWVTTREWVDEYITKFAWEQKREAFQEIITADEQLKCVPNNFLHFIKNGREVYEHFLDFKRYQVITVIFFMLMLLIGGLIKYTDYLDIAPVKLKWEQVQNRISIFQKTVGKEGQIAGDNINLSGGERIRQGGDRRSRLQTFLALIPKFMDRTLENIKDLVKDTTHRIASWLTNEKAYLVELPKSETIDDFYQVRSDKTVSDRHLVSIGGTLVKLTQQGLVVIPYDKETDGETLKQQIGNSFSDRVEVEPDESGTAGLIKPVFKEPGDQDYFYVMVPLDDANLIDQ